MHGATFLLIFKPLGASLGGDVTFTPAGNLCVQQHDEYTPGAAQHDFYVPGAVRKDSFSGNVAAQGNC